MGIFTRRFTSTRGTNETLSSNSPLSNHGDSGSIYIHSSILLQTSKIDIVKITVYRQAAGCEAVPFRTNADNVRLSGRDVIEREDPERTGRRGSPYALRIGQRNHSITEAEARGRRYSSAHCRDRWRRRWCRCRSWRRPSARKNKRERTNRTNVTTGKVAYIKRPCTGGILSIEGRQQVVWQECTRWKCRNIPSALGLNGRESAVIVEGQCRQIIAVATQPRKARPVKESNFEVVKKSWTENSLFSFLIYI